MQNKISKYLLMTLILSLGFGQLLRFDFYSIPIYLHDILVIFLLLLQGQALKVKSFDLRGLALMGIKLFLAGLALGWLRAFTIYPLFSLLSPSLYSLRLLAYIVLYVVIKKSEILIPKEYFLFSGMVLWFIGVIQYIWMPDMRIFQYLGWDDHLSRLTLPHFDPTFTAVMLSLAILITPLKSWYVSLLLSFTILLTYSRSTWLSLAMTAPLFIKNKKILLVSSIFLLLSIFALPQKFGEGTNLLRTYSISSRLTSDWSYAEKYKWDLLIGRGMNTLPLDSADLSHATGPNNSYLYLFLTSGVLGLVGWGMFMWSLYQKSTHKPMLVFFAVASLFNNVMFYPFALIWVLLIESTVPTSA